MANRKRGSLACHFRFRWQLSKYLSENVDRTATIWVSQWTADGKDSTDVAGWLWWCFQGITMVLMENINVDVLNYTALEIVVKAEHFWALTLIIFAHISNYQWPHIIIVTVTLAVTAHFSRWVLNRGNRMFEPTCMGRNMLEAQTELGLNKRYVQFHGDCFWNC